MLEHFGGQLRVLPQASSIPSIGAQTARSPSPTILGNSQGTRTAASARAVHAASWCDGAEAQGTVGGTRYTPYVAYNMMSGRACLPTCL
jgi:hypothetical protein